MLPGLMGAMPAFDAPSRAAAGCRQATAFRHRCNHPGLCETLPAVHGLFASAQRHTYTLLRLYIR